MAEQLDIQAMRDSIQRIIDRAGASIRESTEQEYVGRAADGMVTATIADGDLSIDIHILAKRRMERDDLAAAVLEAVEDAERQATGFPDDLIADVENDESLPPSFRETFGKTMRQMRSILP